MAANFKCPECSLNMERLCSGQFICVPCGTVWEQDELLEIEAEQVAQAEADRRAG